MADERQLRAEWASKLPTPVPAPTGLQNVKPALTRPRIINVNFTSPEGSWSGGPYDAVRVVPILGQGFDQTAKLNIMFDPATLPNGFGPNTVSFAIPMAISGVRQEPFARRWLAGQDKQGLIRGSGESSNGMFASLEPFMGNIGGLDITQARQKLKTDEEAQHGKLSLFGLSVDAGSTVHVMPWITSGILVFLIAHLRQFLRSVSRLKRDSPPWVGLFDDWAGQAVSFITILLMPFGANILLMIRHSPDENLWAAIIALVCLALCSFWAYRELWRLREKLRH